MADILKTAHIHLDNATLRVHVKDSDNFPIKMMMEDEGKPPCILWVGKSSDKSQKKTTILVCVTDLDDLEAIAEWVDKYDSNIF